MTYDQFDADDRDRPHGPAEGDGAGSGPASATRTDIPVVTRTDIPRQTEFRLVSGAGATQSPDEPYADEPYADEPRSPDEPHADEPRSADAQLSPDDGQEPTAPQPVMSVPRQPGRPPADDDVPLLSGMKELRASWQRVKASFVDNPREAVAEAAGLTDEAAEALAASLRERRHRIRGSWDTEATARDTEALRVALVRYQALFDRIAGEG